MKKRSLVAAIAMLVVSAIVLTSATFAWFSMGDSVTVTNFQVGVAEADGLMISADNANWGTTVTIGAVETANEYRSIVIGNNSLMFPVSGTGIGTATWYSGYLAGSTAIIEAMTRTGTGANKGYFYDFPVYILYKGTGTTTVSLNGSSITNASDAKANSDAAAAARLAVYDDSATETDVLIPKPTTGESYTYVSSVSGTTPTNSPLSASHVKTAASDITVNLTANTAKKVWITLWLEGTDAQCTDAIAAGGKLDVSLVFAKVS